MLAKSSHAPARDLYLALALWRVLTSFEWCSTQPGLADIYAFCTNLSMWPLTSIYLSHLRMEVKSVPIQDVKVMALKLDGCDGSLWTFQSALMAASFHDSGTVEVDQQVLNRSSKALSRDGHLLKTT